MISAELRTLKSVTKTQSDDARKMVVQIGQDRYELHPCAAGLLKVQADMLHFLALAWKRDIRVMPKGWIAYCFGLRSAAPVEARLRHLEQHGAITRV
jgi:hypothetical protein